MKNGKFNKSIWVNINVILSYDQTVGRLFLERMNWFSIRSSPANASLYYTHYTSLLYMIIIIMNMRVFLFRRIDASVFASGFVWSMKSSDIILLFIVDAICVLQCLLYSGFSSYHHDSVSKIVQQTTPMITMKTLFCL